MNYPAATTPAQRTLNSSVRWISIILFVMLAHYKMSPYLPYGRFWAEEGAVNMAALHGKPWYLAPIYVFHGHLELANNLLILLASHVPFLYAPIITTLGSVAIQLLAIAMLCGAHQHLGLNTGWLVLLVVMAVVLPQSNEVFANSTNLHFHFTLIVLLLALSPIVESPGKRHLALVLLAFSGLSSIAANFLAPLLIWQSIKERDARRWIQCGVMLVTTATQAGLLLTHPAGTTARTVAKPSIDTLAALITQLELTPLSLLLPLGKQVSLLQLGHYEIGQNLLLLAAGTLVWISLIGAASFLRDRLSLQLLAASTFVALVSALLALDPSQRDLISLNHSGRYFYVPCLIFLMGIGRLLSRPQSWTLTVPPLLLAIACASTLTPDHSGPRWQDAYAVAMQSGSSEIDIWPFGWQMPNFSRPPGKPNDQVKLVTLDTASLGARGQFTLQSYDAHALSNTDGRTLRLTISASVPQKTIQILYVITPDAPVSSSLAAEPSGRWTAMLQFDTPKRAQQASAALCLAAGMSDGQIRLLMPVGAACANSVRGN